MAPRGGRSSKRAGLQRIDAAFDALIPLGFSREVIRNAIKNLLKAYGGDEGWVFIEEASYKLLIETILEQQQEEEQNHNMEEPEGEDEDNSRALRTNEQVVDAGSTSTPAAIELGGLHSGVGDLAQTSGEVDEREDAFPVPAGYANLNLLSVTYVDSHPHDFSAVTGVVAHNELPTRKRPPCYGWISETESDSESEDEP